MDADAFAPLADLLPGDHTGFVDDPAAFAQRLRTVLGTA